MGKYVSDYDILLYRMVNSEIDRIHHPFRNEKEFWDLIRTCNFDAVKAYFQSISNQTLSPDSDDSEAGIGIMAKQKEKQLEYAAVLTISFAARIAIEAGMNAFDAYDLNDLYLQRISESFSPADMVPMVLEAVQRFMQGIQAAEREKDIPAAICAAQAYINRNLTHEMSVASIAEAVGLTPNYLSSLFHAQTGMTISEYITDKRIEAAKNSLKYSDISIDQIAEYSCFHSRSYFGTVFKKKTGYSPAQYRKNNAASTY